MVTMSRGMRIKTTTHSKKSAGSGITQGIKRLLSGESFFLNVFTATQNNSTVILAPPVNGDILYQPLSAGRALVIKGGAYLGHHGSVSLDIQWGGLTGFFAANSLFWIKVLGTGHVLCNSFGTIYPITVSGKWIVDTNYLVAFENTLSYRLSTIGKSVLGSFLSGEKLVVEFSGNGTVWCQSHSFDSLGQLLKPFLKATRRLI